MEPGALKHKRVSVGDSGRISAEGRSGQCSVRSIMYEAHLLQGPLDFFLLLTVPLVPNLLSPEVRTADVCIPPAVFSPENTTRSNLPCLTLHHPSDGFSLISRMDTSTFEGS